MKTSVKYPTLLLLMSLTFFTGCSLQKRIYTKGYYISWKKAPLKKAPPATQKESPDQIKEQLRLVQGVENYKAATQETGLTASAKPNGHKMRPVSIYSLPTLTLSCGDKITFRNGDVEEVKVYDIGPDYIKYKSCDNLEGPFRKISKAQVFMVKYTDGKKEVFKKTDDQNPKASSSTWNENKNYKTTPAPALSKKANGNAVAGFVLALFSWTIILAPFAFIMSAVGLSQCNNNPDQYYGKGFAIAGLLISIIVILIIISAIAL